MSLPLDFASFVSALGLPATGPAWLPIADAVVKASLLLGAAAASSFLLRRASASARHFVWTVALVTALVVPVLSLALPRWQVPVVVLASDTRPAEAAATPTALPLHRDASARLDRSERASAPAAVPAAPALDRPAPISISWQAVLFIIWSAGVAAILGRLLVGVLAVQWMSRRTERVTDAPWLPLARELARELGISSRLVFLRSPRATMPMAWGVVRPAVLMPMDADDWPVERLRIVLLHELAHVKRRDCLTHMVAQVACAAYWFNPLAWMAARHARSERERACDDLVLAAGTRGSDYAEELLEMARVMRSGRFPAVLTGATLAMAHRSQLEGRLISILDPSVRRAGMTRIRTLAASTAVTFAVMPLAALQPWTYSSPHIVATDDTPQATGAPAVAAQDPSTAPTSEPAPEASSQDAPNPRGRVNTGTISSHAAASVAQSVSQSVATSVSTSVTESVGRSSIESTIDSVVASLGLSVHATAHPRPSPMPSPQGDRVERSDPRTIAALTAALKDTDKEVRETAMHALVQMRDPSIFDPLVQALHDESPDVREQAAMGLGQLHDKRAVDPLMAAVKDANAGVREQAVFALGQLRDARAVDTLAGATKDASGSVREQAAFALGQIRDARAVPALTAALKDADEDVREQAVFALGQLRDPAAIDGITIALKDAKPDVREQAAFALGQIRDRRAVDPLTAALKDTDADVREQAAFALGQIRDRAAVEPLLFALKDADEDVREQAAFALGQLRDARAIDALTTALKDTSSSVRQQAAFALGQISR